MMNWITYALGCLLSALLTGVFIGWRVVQLQRDRDQWRGKAEWLAEHPRCVSEGVFCKYKLEEFKRLNMLCSKCRLQAAEDARAVKP